MSLVLRTENSFLLDHNKFVEEAYGNCQIQADAASRQTLILNPAYFDIPSPHIGNADQEKQELAKKKSRKRKIPLNEEEIASEEYHLKITPNLQKAVEEVLGSISRTSKTVAKHSLHSLKLDCNSCSQLFRNLCLKSCFDANDGTLKIPDSDPFHLDHNDILDRLVHYNSESSRMICISKENYILPSNCSFLLSDVRNINPLIDLSTKNGGFDVIVIDPPWENKSAKRGKKYQWLSLDEIEKIPLKKLASEHCYVLVWVTNKQKIHNFVKDKLFPANNIQFITEWYWVKIATSGEPIFAFNSTHKRPYEVVIIGQCSSVVLREASIKPATFLSIPCTVHSHKPPLRDIIRECLPGGENLKCLEMFARNLTPWWTSWGNEVLYMQNLKHFSSCSTD